MEVDLFEVTGSEAPDLHLEVSPNALTDNLASEIRTLLGRFPGPSQVLLHVGQSTLRLPDEWRVEASSGLIAEIRVLAGVGIRR